MRGRFKMATFDSGGKHNKENMLVIDNSNKGLKKLERPEVNDSTAQCTTLILDKNGLSKIDHLEVYPHLQQLSIANNRLVRMNGVAKLRTLRVLNLPNNSIQTIEGLRELLDLEWLNLSGNSIKNVEHLSTNVKLRYLDLSDNSISVVSDISMLSNLKTLLLHGNILTTLRSFPAYIPTSLDILSLAENEISDLAEVSYLSCLSNLKQLSVMNNPCVMFASSAMSSHGGFDYRPYIVNWCLTIEILDGSAITQKESLKAEWLYSQGKGRKFYPGQHVPLAEYLSQICPLTTISEFQSKEEERLLKVLKQQKKHMHELSHTPRQSPANPQPVVSPSSPSLPEQGRSTSAQKPIKSPGTKKTRRAASPLRSPLGKSPSPPHVQSPQTAPSRAWPSVSHGGKEPVLHKNFNPGGKVASNAMDLTLQDIEKESISDEVLDSVSAHLPMDSSSHHASDHLILPKVTTSDVLMMQSIKGLHQEKTHSQQPDKFSHKFPTINPQQVEDDEDKIHLSLSQYDMYESRPLKTPQEVKGYLEQVSIEDSDPSSEEKLDSMNSILRSNSHNDGRQKWGRNDGRRTKRMDGDTEGRRRGGSMGYADELRHIKDVARTKKISKTAVTPDASRNDNKVREKLTQGTRNHSKPDNLGRKGNEGSKAKGEEESAVKIQALWRGHQTRQRNETVLNIQEALKSQRMDDHVKFLTMELERTRQLYEQEKHLRVLQMEALKLLWNQVKTLQEWKHSVSKSETSQLSSDHEISGDTEKRGSREFAYQREIQLEQTCEHLQKQVSRLQASLDQISNFITSSPTASSPLVQPLNKQGDLSLSITKGKQSDVSPERNRLSEQEEISRKMEHQPHVTTPQNISVSPRSSTSIGLSWEPSQVIDENGSLLSGGVKGYKLHINLRGSEWVMEVPGTQTSLGGLVPGTYKFAVSAFTSFASSNLSPWKEIHLSPSPQEQVADSSMEGNPQQIPHKDLITPVVDKNFYQHANDIKLGQAEVKGDSLYKAHGLHISHEEGSGSVDGPKTFGRDKNGSIESTACSDVAREMSVEIIESLLSRVLSKKEDSSGGKGPSVSSQNHPSGGSERFAVQEGDILSRDKQDGDVTLQLLKKSLSESEGGGSLLQSVRLDSETDESSEKSQEAPMFVCEDMDPCKATNSCKNKKPTVGESLNNHEPIERNIKIPGQKKVNPSKLAITFSLNDSLERDVDGCGSTSVLEGTEIDSIFLPKSDVDEAKNEKNMPDIARKSNGTLKETSDSGTFDVLLPIEKLIQGGSKLGEVEEDDDVFQFPSLDERLKEHESKDGRESVPERTYPSHGDERSLHMTSSVSQLPKSGHPAHHHFNRNKTKSNVSIKAPLKPDHSPCKSSILKGRYHHKKGGPGRFGVRRSGSEPNLSIMEDKPKIAKNLLSPDSTRLGSDLMSNKVRRSSAGSSSGLLKSNEAKRSHSSECQSQEKPGKSKSSSKGQQVLPLNLKGKKSKSSNIPGIVSPGYQRPKSPSKLPVKQVKDKTTGLASSASSNKLIGRLVYPSKKHDSRINNDKLNDNNSNSTSDEMEDAKSWETVSESDKENGRVTTAFN